MQISRPNAQTPTPEDLQELAKLKTLIEHAMSDGKITHDEMATIEREIIVGGHHSADQIYRELELLRSLVNQKLASGELSYDWNK